MKKIVSIALVLAMLGCLFAGCGAKSEVSAKTDAPAETTAPVDYASMSIEELKPLLKTVTNGKLTVATSPDFAPYEFYSLAEDGTPTLCGFDIALAGYIANYLGLELEIVPMDFDGTLMELANKKTDLSMAGYSPDPSREDKMDFSDIYYTGGQSFVTVKELADKFTTLEDANKAEYQIGAQIASIQADLAKKHTPNADIVELGKVTDIVAELLGGKLDGAIIETVVAETYAKTYEGLVVALPVPYEAEGSAVGVSKGNAPLLAAVNLAIHAAIEDGSMAQYVAEANEAAAGETYEGLLDANGNVAG